MEGAYGIPGVEGAYGDPPKVDGGAGRPATGATGATGGSGVGETSAGVIRYIKGVEPIYAHARTIARASAGDIRRQTAEFERAINATTNLLAKAVIPNVGKARAAELKFEARLGQLPNAAP